MYSLINIHSHLAGAEDEITIQNIHQQFAEPITGNYFSAGIHPCYIHEQTCRNQLDELSLLIKNPSVVAVGECGLDRICETDFFLQEEIFKAQIHLANDINKPLVIHCVRAFEEVRAALKQNRTNVPVIWHGFSKKSIQLSNDLLKDGAYLSFGTILFQESMYTLFKSIPDDRFFLETDNTEKAILSVYEQAAKIKNYTINEIAEIIHNNTKQVFRTINL